MQYSVSVPGFAIILKRKRNLVALLLLYYTCTVTINVLWLFLTLPWVGLQCVIVIFPDHTHFLYRCTWTDNYKLTVLMVNNMECR